jgi:glucose/arabinose dehydrogenase
MKRTMTAAFLIAFAPSVALLTLVPGCPPLMPPAQPPLDSVTIGLESVAQGLTSPVGMAVPDDGTGRLFLLDQVGRILIVDSQDNLRPQPFLDISGRLVELMPDFDERGLLSLAFHPSYGENGRFFVVYNAPLRPDDPEDFNSVWRLSEFRVSQTDPNLADPDSESVLLEVLKPQFNHNGGQLLFGPDDLLYVTLGDGGRANDVGFGHTEGIGNGQDLSKPLGKMLRFNADTPGMLTVPSDNAFVGDSSVLESIFAYGLRNPWRCSFDMGGRHRLFCSDAGQDLFEEINIIESGQDYGWNIREGTHCFDPENPMNPPAQCADAGPNGRPLIDPIIEYEHFDQSEMEVRLAAVGGYVYRGNDVPALSGRYVFGDWSSSFTSPDGTLFAAEEDADGRWRFSELTIGTTENGRIDRYVLAFGQDLDGEVYVLTTRNAGPAGETGEVFRIVPGE